MRFTTLLPLTFLAGQHGFMIFAPYLAVCLASIHLIRSARMRQRRLAFRASLVVDPVATA
jgi:hypothetical protein